ncbi:hypothetical protein BTH42_18615 [Burkholderia sp. SRS-W-2-2016]|uniref:hypothetical protein n=1 Tax=Burkholderia sp. SRS-W-2-2016 TaxID=1926878 RepID=UPI00094AF0E0|nr:hypothetical protein [Burkholderia sp. SRS-W-2-2016]OLL30128.1 hypothetical protein BTH42_18615 [Burkholderia sp. SRS-W-2-2016]
MGYMNDWANQTLRDSTGAIAQAQRVQAEVAARREREHAAADEAEDLRRTARATHLLRVEQKRLELARLRADTVDAQLVRWRDALPPEQRCMRRSFADIRAAIRGVRIGTNATNPALAAALRRAGWCRERDWRDASNGYRIWWYPPVWERHEADAADFGWYD